MFKKQHLIYIGPVLGGIVFIILLILTSFVIYDAAHQDEHLILGGKGTIEMPYRLFNEDDYIFFCSRFKSWDDDFVYSYVSLENDIYLTGEGSGMCIGNKDDGIYFAGEFEGNGHSIHGLCLKGEGASMFPLLRGTVKNLGVCDSEISGKECAALAGEIQNLGKVINCFTDADTEGELSAGLCARNFGLVNNCASIKGVCIRFNDVIGVTKNCFNAENRAKEISDILNEDIYSMNDNGTMYMWDETCHLTSLAAPYIESISTGTVLDGKRCEIKAFLSPKSGHFCMALPESVKKDEHELCLSLGNGIKKAITVRSPSDTFEESGRKYRIDFYYYDDVPTLMVKLYNGTELKYVNASTDNLAYADFTEFDKNGNYVDSSARVEFAGRGNDSFTWEKKSYKIKFNKKKSVAGLDKNYEFNLISGGRDNSLFTYEFTRDLYREMGLDFVHSYRPVNLFVDGNNMGLYLLTNKMEISPVSFDLEDLKINTQRYNGKLLYQYAEVDEGGYRREAKNVYYDIPNDPPDITGGYLLDMSNNDFDEDRSRFTSDNGCILSSKGDRFLTKKELEYIRNLYQDFEDALYSEDGYNKKGRYYASYIDMDSYAIQWLLYEFMMEPSRYDSVYFYKDSDSRGDGLIHAVWCWDVEHSFVDDDDMEEMYYSKYPKSFWNKLYSHEDFRQTLKKCWDEKFIPAIDRTLEKDEHDNKNGVGTFDWYEKQYGASLIIEDQHFLNADYKNKVRAVEAFIRQRREVMDRFIQGKVKSQIE